MTLIEKICATLTNRHRGWIVAWGAISDFWGDMTQWPVRGARTVDSPHPQRAIRIGCRTFRRYAVVRFFHPPSENTRQGSTASERQHLHYAIASRRERSADGYIWSKLTVRTSHKTMAAVYQVVAGQSHSIADAVDAR